MAGFVKRSFFYYSKKQKLKYINIHDFVKRHKDD